LIEGLIGWISALQMKPYNIYVTVAYPPDTDTPGFVEENKTKVKGHFENRSNPSNIISSS
jgi:hypothetical protein